MPKRRLLAETHGYLPVKEYRARILHRCLCNGTFIPLHTYKRSRPKACASGPTSLPESVVDLLEFLQNDAAPYEVNVQPYLQNAAIAAEKLRERHAQRRQANGSAHNAGRLRRTSSAEKQPETKQAVGSTPETRPRLQLRKRAPVTDDSSSTATAAGPGATPVTTEQAVAAVRGSPPTTTTSARDASALPALAAAPPVGSPQSRKRQFRAVAPLSSQQEPQQLSHPQAQPRPLQGLTEGPQQQQRQQSAPQQAPAKPAATATPAATEEAEPQPQPQPQPPLPSFPQPLQPQQQPQTQYQPQTQPKYQPHPQPQPQAPPPPARESPSQAVSRLLAARRAAVQWQWSRHLGSAPTPPRSVAASGAAATPASTSGAPDAASAAANAAAVAAAAAADRTNAASQGQQQQRGLQQQQEEAAKLDRAGAASSELPSYTVLESESASPPPAQLQPAPQSATTAAAAANTGAAAAETSSRATAAPFASSALAVSATQTPASPLPKPQPAPPAAPARRLPPWLLPLTIQGRIARMEAAVDARRPVHTPTSAPKTALAPASASATKATKAAPAPTHAGNPSAAAMARLASRTAVAAPSPELLRGSEPASISGPPLPRPSTLASASTEGESGSGRQNAGVGAAAAREGGEQSDALTRPGTGSCAIGTDPETASSSPPLPDAAAEAAEALPPEVTAARELFQRLSHYRPTGREDGPLLLAPHARYHRAQYQAAAEAAAKHPDLLLAPLALPQLSYIAAGYAAAGHKHEPFMQALASVALDKLLPAARPPSSPRLRGNAAAGRPDGRSFDPSAANAPPSGGGGGGGATSAPTAPLTFRSACVLLTALARLCSRVQGSPAPRSGDGAVGRLTAALAVWLARKLRSGTVTPRNKYKGTWLAAALWAYATLQRNSNGADGAGGGAAAAAATAAAAASLTAAGAALFTEAAEAVRVAPGWLQLLDCREALWALWAFRVAAVAYDNSPSTAAASAAAATGAVAGPALAAAAGGQWAPAAAAAAAARVRVSYEPDPLVELKLVARASSMFAQLDPGQLAEAFAVVAEAGLGADRDVLTALRRASIARAAATRPLPLAVMVAALAVMKVQDVVWLSALAAACRNQMINMKPEQIVVVLHSFAVALRLHYPPLFHAAAVMCTLPGFHRLAGMGPGEVLRLLGAFAATGHYERALMRRAAERILSLGPAASTPWQRATLLHLTARLAHRDNPLLRAVAAETFALALPTPSLSSQSSSATGAAATAAPPPAVLVATVAAACGELQYRPPGLLAALAAARVAAAAPTSRLSLGSRASLCWAVLALTGGLGLGCENGSHMLHGLVPAAGAAGAAAVDSRGAGEPVTVAGADTEGTRHQRKPRQNKQQQLKEVQQLRNYEQQRQAVAALVDYLRVLAATPSRQWPGAAAAASAAGAAAAASATATTAAAAASHHAQLLAACRVLTWRPAEEGPYGIARPVPPPSDSLPAKAASAAPQDVPAADGASVPPAAADAPAAAAAAAVLSPDASVGAIDTRAAIPRGGSSAGKGAGGGGGAPWDRWSAQLRLELQQLPAAAVRRTLTAQRRARLAALGAWAEQVAAVMRDAVAAATCPAGDGAEALGAVAAEGEEEGAGGGGQQGGTAVSAVAVTTAGCRRRLTLEGCRVTTGVVLCEGALAVDVCLQLDVAEEEDVEEEATKKLDDSGSGRSGAGTTKGPVPRAITHDGGGVAGELRGCCSRQRRRVVMVALELCAPLPVGVPSGDGGNGGGVVRNSRWLLSGGAAVRRRLLSRLGWVVLPVRERSWKDMRSPQQLQRGATALLWRALEMAAAAGGGGGGGNSWSDVSDVRGNGVGSSYGTGVVSRSGDAGNSGVSCSAASSDDAVTIAAGMSSSSGSDTRGGSGSSGGRGGDGVRRIGSSSSMGDMSGNGTDGSSNNSDEGRSSGSSSRSRGRRQPIHSNGPAAQASGSLPTQEQAVGTGTALETAGLAENTPEPLVEVAPLEPRRIGRFRRQREVGQRP